MENDVQADIQEIERLRQLAVEAENSGNAAFFDDVFAEDVVIMPPNIPAMEGKSACLAFIRDVLDDVRNNFERAVPIAYVTAETLISGDLAVDET